MLTIRRGLVAVAAAAVSTVTVVAGAVNASAQTPGMRVGPNQLFSAQVNHSSGYPQPARVLVDCPGPVRVGQTGHPLRGQSVEVTPAATTNRSAGFTGRYAHEIGAFFGAPPPAGAVPGYVAIVRYNTAVPIPKKLTLPCVGTGEVTFVPLPMDPGVSRDAVVPVVYIPACPTPVCPAGPTARPRGSST